MRRLHQGHLGGYGILDTLTLHFLHRHLLSQLDIYLRALLSLHVALSRNLQLPGVETLHRTLRASVAHDASLCHDVAFAPRSEGGARDRHGEVLLPLLDARLLHAAPLHDCVRRYRHGADFNRSLAYAICRSSHRVHGYPRASPRPVLSTDLDQEKVVPAHSDRHLLPILFPVVHVVWFRNGIRLSLRTVQED